MADFTHFNENGRAKMVDVSEKADTVRTAVAAAAREAKLLVSTSVIPRPAPQIFQSLL